MYVTLMLLLRELVGASRDATSASSVRDASRRRHVRLFVPLSLCESSIFLCHAF